MKREPVSYAASELATRTLDDLPDELVLGRHLVYSSPATLAYNSPGAEGFGVKRAGLAIPGSVMLLVAPGCCGRNTSLVSSMPAYRNRFFYLTMDEIDIVSGRHLPRITEAVEAVVDSLATRPTVVMICITCVDALLGTDMERVCRAAEDKVGVPVRPCYMYALTREGRRPPMVAVRETLYSMLEPLPKRSRSANILGFFAALQEGCELADLLRQAGIRAVRQIATCKDFDEFLLMAEANFNVVVNPEARLAARYLERRLKIPSIELTRLYDPERVHTQYQALARVLSCTFDDEAYLARATDARDRFVEGHADTCRLAIGECANADPFELALSLTRAGLTVREVFGTLSPENLVWMRRLADLSPKTRIFSNQDPSMIHYDESATDVTLAIGKDASWYHPSSAHLAWNEDAQPFGYQGIEALYSAMGRALEEVSHA